MIRRLAEMTAPEVADAITAGIATVILPLGSTEQHGPHLPLATDSVRAAALADGLAAAMPGCLVAPVLPVGCSDEHTGFAGLIGLDHATLAAALVDCAKRMAAWGVRCVVLLSAHGGNAAALKLACTRLAAEEPGLHVCIPTSSIELGERLADIAAGDGIAVDAVGLHAGEGETSEMLQLRPDLVRMDRAVVGYVGSMTEVMPRLKCEGLLPVTASGTLGDPRPASANRGARYLAARIDGLQQIIAGANNRC
jgi:Uncharacterized protein, putative amidase